MKAVIQRVKRASVKIENREESIGKGIVALIGVGREDTEKDIKYLAEKVLNLRIFEDEKKKMNFSLQDINGEILIISQFTLYGDTRKGRRPDFTGAASPDKAKNLYEKFIELTKGSGLVVKSGKFGAHMLVEIHNDGPVTIILNSKNNKEDLDACCKN